ncbi:hypothetical protein ACFYZ9_33720 [Streptomyces sp. NPDC001691]|uniref:hypothetical protein n=1 Tax=Streptomyces sp. NPDC001691 TaxID=3364600 RepID=UPI0036C39718
MPPLPELLHPSVQARLTAAGIHDATITRRLYRAVIASVPKPDRTNAEIALRDFITLPMQDREGRARIAVFGNHTADEDPYRRIVYFRVTGPDLPTQYVGREVRNRSLLVPGETSEADLPAILATNLFRDAGRATDITITDLP